MWTRALRKDFEINPLTRLLWGIEPHSPKRRSRSLVALLGPAALFFAIALPLYIVFVRRFWASAGDAITVTPLFAGLIVGVVAIVYRAFLALPPSFSRPLRDELRLAGIRTGQVLWAVGSARLLGAALFGALVLLAGLPISVLQYSAGLTSMGIAMAYYGCLGFMILSAPLADLLASAQNRSRAYRFSLVCLFSIFTSPLIALFIVSTLGGLGGNLTRVLLNSVFFILEPLSWFVRSYFLRRWWARVAIEA